MPRPLSSVAKAAIFAQETTEVFLVLLTINHADLTTPIRVVNNLTDIVSRGDTYVGFPFQVTLPDERSDQLSKVRLRIDNVDRQIVIAIRSITSPPTVDLEVILASAPNTLEGGPFNFTLRDVQYDSLTVEGEISFEDVLNEPYPGDSYSPNLYPGLH